MAELAASLIGIIAAGTRVALVLSTTASDIGSAGKEAQVMAREIRSFCAILRNITQTIDVVRDTRHVSHCADLVSEMTAVSQDMFTEILDLVEYLQKSSWSGQAGSRMKLAARIKWVINKPKIAFLRTAIEAYKADLCLLLGSMQFAQSLDAPTTVSRRSSIAQAPQLNRASRALSQNMEELALDYRSSLQELEAARNAWDDSEENGNEALDDVEANGMDGETMTLTQNPELQCILESLREEVSSLNSNRSSLSSTTASSIYNALSTHSNRLSLLIEDLPVDKSPAFQSLRRMSQRMSRLSAAYQPEYLPPIQEAIPIPPRETAQKVFEDMQSWPSGSPPWGNVTSTKGLIQVLLLSTIEQKDGPRQSMYLKWAKQVLEGVTGLPLQTRRQYLDKLYDTLHEPATKRNASSTRQFEYSALPYRSPIPSTETAKSNPATGLFQRVNISVDDPCREVLPIALKRYNISGPPGEYQLILAWGDEERIVGAEERPLRLFRQLEREGKSPMFTLRQRMDEAVALGLSPTPGTVITTPIAKQAKTPTVLGSFI